MKQNHSGLLSRMTSWSGRMRSPSLDWIQVEVTSHCNAACTYCPRTLYRDVWNSRHMEIDTFMRLKPVLGRTQLVYLQGWGEPILNPDLFRMVRAAREAGCAVGMTTNGTCLDEGAIRRMIDEGVDILALSLAGTDARNDEARKGTHIEKVLAVVDEIGEAKRKRASQTPAVHVAYMLLRSGIEMLPALPTLLRDRGIAQVVVSTLDFSSNTGTDIEMLTPSTEEEYGALKARLDGVVEGGRRLGVPIHYRLVRPGTPRAVCTENITRAFFVSADGLVSPCVYMNIPVSGGGCDRQGSSRAYARTVHGSLISDDVRDVWNSAGFRAFREGFTRGVHPAQCRQCPKLYEE